MYICQDYNKLLKTEEEMSGGICENCKNEDE